MKFIADGGIVTKNTLTYTKGAISLTLSTSYIDGVSLDVAYTIDDVFIMYDRDSLLLTTQGKGYFQTSTYNDLLHYNIGTKVLNARVVTLKETLEVYKNSDKLLILGLSYQGEKTEQYTYQILELISEYPNINIYLKSSDKQILNILKTTPNKARIGIIINEDNREEMNNEYDFYVINDYGINKDLILKKMNANKDIMTELIQYPNDLINAYYTYGKYILYRLFVIAKEPNAIYNTFKEIQPRI